MTKGKSRSGHKPKRSAKQIAAQKKATAAAKAVRRVKQKPHRPTLAKGGRYSELTCGKPCRPRLDKMAIGEVRARKRPDGHVIEIVVKR